MNRTGTAVAIAALALTMGCSGSSAGPTAGTTPSAPPSTANGCPPVHGNGFAAIDYVDFIQAFGQQYVAGLGTQPVRVSRSDRGQTVLHSRCSFSALNDKTQKSPGDPRDGDTGFLKPGTPIYAINGWPTKCRLAADSGTGLHAYLALKAHAKHATPRKCALDR